MTVMAASVEDTRVATCIRKAGILLDRKCIHASPQADRTCRIPDFERCDNTGSADAIVNIQPEVE